MFVDDNLLMRLDDTHAYVKTKFYSHPTIYNLEDLLNTNRTDESLFFKNN